MAFKMRSGSSTSFKQMGSSPAKDAGHVEDWEGHVHPKIKAEKAAEAAGKAAAKAAGKMGGMKDSVLKDLQPGMDPDHAHPGSPNKQKTDPTNDFNAPGPNAAGARAARSPERNRQVDIDDVDGKIGVLGEDLSNGLITQKQHDKKMAELRPVEKKVKKSLDGKSAIPQTTKTSNEYTAKGEGKTGGDVEVGMYAKNKTTNKVEADGNTYGLTSSKGTAYHIDDDGSGKARKETYGGKGKGTDKMIPVARARRQMKRKAKRYND